MVNFMCQLDCRSLIAGKTWFLCIYEVVPGRMVKVNKELLNCWTEWSRWRSPMWAGTTQSLESMNRTKGRRRANSLSLLEQTLILSCLQTLVLLVLWLSEADQNLHQWPSDPKAGALGLKHPTGSLVLQLIGGRWRGHVSLQNSVSQCS